MKPIICFFILMVSIATTNAKEIPVSDDIDTPLNKNQGNMMIMNSKPKKVTVKIDRTKGYYQVDSDLMKDPESEELFEDIDTSEEEKELSKTISEIAIDIKNDSELIKAKKIKEELDLENSSLEDTESRYKKLLKIDSTPREPTSSMEIEVSPF